MPTQSILWLVAVVLLFWGEAVTVGLVSIWFGVGALAGLLTSLFCPNVWIQLTVFLIVAFACLLAVRPLVKRYITPRGTAATNADRAIGMEGTVIEAIDNLKARGQVTVRGAVWTARSENDELIPTGTRVQVLRIEGVKVIVSPLPACAPGDKSSNVK